MRDRAVSTWANRRDAACGWWFRAARRLLFLPRTAVIIDLDGTLVDVIPARYLVQGPRPDFDAFHRYGTGDAELNAEAVTIYRWARRRGHRILLHSGRAEKWKPRTAHHLQGYGIVWDELHLRPRIFDTPEGASAVDPYLKHRLAMNAQAKYRVILAVDDQPTIGRVMAGLGIPVRLIPGWTAADEESMKYGPDIYRLWPVNAQTTVGGR